MEQTVQRPFEPKHLSIEYLRYLDTLLGNMIANSGGDKANTFGAIRFEIAKGRPGQTWVETSHKEGYQY